VHAGAVDAEATLATEGVVDGQGDQAGGGEDPDQQACQGAEDGVEVPGGVAEEAVVAAVVAGVGRAAGLDQLGDEAVAVRQQPAGHQGHEGDVTGGGEVAGELQ